MRLRTPRGMWILLDALLRGNGYVPDSDSWLAANCAVSRTSESGEPKPWSIRAECSVSRSRDKLKRVQAASQASLLSTAVENSDGNLGGASFRAMGAIVAYAGQQRIKQLDGIDCLIKAIEGSAAGQTYVDPAVAGKLFTHVAGMTVVHDSAVADLLSPREREILSLLANGQSNTDIAAQLFLS